MLIKIIQTIFYKLGYKIILYENYKPIDQRQSGNSPLSLLYNGYKQSILIDVSMQDGRGLPLFTFKNNGYNPFIFAANEAKNKKYSKEIIYNVLKKYYELVQPENAAAVLGVSPHDVPLLAYEPSWAAVLPWDSENISQWKKSHKETILKENRKHGKTITVKDGWAWCGPISHKKLSIETNRFFKVLKSIQTKGYLRHDGSDGDIYGVVLINSEKQWKWQATAGQHRVSILSALGYQTIPVRIIKIVKRDEVELWPNVVSGVFSIETALKLFDQIFNGVLPHSTEKWVNYLNEIRNNKDEK